MTGWDEVWRISFLPLAVILVLSLAWHALKLSRKVVRVPPVLGRHPNKDDPDALRKTINRLKDLRSSYWLGLLSNWVQLGLFGVLLPAVMFFEACLYVSSFLETGAFVLVAGGSLRPVEPTGPQALLYVWDQISSALTLGLFEILQRKPWTTLIVHDPQIPGVLPVVFFFRGVIDFFSGAWIFAGLLASWNVIAARTKIQKRIDRHDLELLDAVRAQANTHAIAAQPDR